MSLRDISIILKSNHVSHGIVITKDNGTGKGIVVADNRQQQQSSDSNNNKSLNVKATQAYELYNKGKNL
jgi:hypothetical protein